MHRFHMETKQRTDLQVERTAEKTHGPSKARLLQLHRLQEAEGCATKGRCWQSIVIGTQALSAKAKI